MKPQRRQAKPVHKERVHHRRRRHRVINAPRLIFSLLLILLLVEAVIAVFKIPWLEIRNVQVYGRKLVPAEFVAKYTSVPRKSNIFLFRTHRMARRLCWSPIVERATVSRRLPNTLIVRITERTAEFTLSAQGRYYEVDAVGVPFRRVVQPDPKVPEVLCEVSKPITLGKRIKSPALISAVDCLKIAKTKKNLQVGKITVDQNNDLCLNVRDGLLIRLGQPQQIEDKLDKAARTIELEPNLEYVDVTCPEAPALKPKSGSSSP